MVSSYGASDLEINIGVETEWTIALRARCSQDRALCVELFGRDTPPMIFQYNVLDHWIEPLPGGELAFTICGNTGAAPKLRYNLHDLGGVYRFRDLEQRLRARGLAAADLADRHSCFPVLFVYGRSDLTVAFFGAKVYPSDVEATILEHAVLSHAVRSFQFASYEDDRVDRRMAVHLELSPDVGRESLGLTDTELSEIFYAGLARSNQDFREVTRMFTANALEIACHAHGTGPFEGADIRIKARYITPRP